MNFAPSPVTVTVHDHAVEVARQALGDAAFAVTWDLGDSTTLVEFIDDALAHGESANS